MKPALRFSGAGVFKRMGPREQLGIGLRGCFEGLAVWILAALFLGEDRYWWPLVRMTDFSLLHT